MTTSKVRVDGRLCFWKLGEHFDRDAVYDALDALGWKSNCPLARSATSALKEAMREIVRQWNLPGVLVRDLEDADEDGVSVVREDKGVVENNYTTLFTCRWTKATSEGEPFAQVTAYASTVDETAIDKWFQHYRKRITQHSVAKMLRVIVTERLNGTSLRPSGGVYWLPAEAIEQLEQLAGKVSDACDTPDRCKLYLPEFNLTDPEAVEAVRDAITDDITKRRREITDQAKRDGVKERALKARRRDAQALHNRVQRYEGYLGETLKSLHEVADACESDVVDAAVQEFPDIFGIGDKVKQAQSQPADLVEADDVAPEAPSADLPVVPFADVTADDVNPFACV